MNDESDPVTSTSDPRRIDVATTDFAVDVHLQVTANYYAALLHGIQKEANLLGYRFVEGLTDDDMRPIPEMLKVFLDMSLANARRQYLYPLKPALEHVMDDIVDGYASRFVDDILAALRGRGLVLAALPRAHELLMSRGKEIMSRLTDEEKESLVVGIFGKSGAECSRT